jgi:oligopeptide/dipeptide ABC transporter ATP-binding protein
MSETLLELNDLTVQYRTDEGAVTAASDVSFSIQEEEYFGLVGESGCGKSTIATALIGGLDANGEIASGEIEYKGHALHEMSEEELNQEIRWKEISFIPQGSLNSLDPLMRIEAQAGKLIDIHSDMTEQEGLERLRDLFETVGLQEERVTDYPHQFSGGMQQRAIIAFALLLNPSLVIADEPTTALDVIMQDQVFKYLDKLKDERNISLLLITHDISVVFESCDRMGIMHAGQIAEVGSVLEIYDQPYHPYSILLQQAFPDVEDPDRELVPIEGKPPRNIGEVDYCTFYERCPWATDACQESTPPLDDLGMSDTNGHKASCIHKEDIVGSDEYEDLTIKR